MAKGEGNVALGEYVRARRQSKQLDIADCATRTGLDLSYWYKLEGGHYDHPDPTNLQRIAETIGCPLEDLYALCGYPIPGDMPTLTPYLRTKHDLPPEAIRDMERYFTQLRSYYGIPDEQPVFPPPPPSQPRAKRARPSKDARNAASHPWRGSAA